MSWTSASLDTTCEEAPWIFFCWEQLDVSKNSGTPKWMVENNGSKPYEQMDVHGGFPIFLETPNSWVGSGKRGG